MDISALATDPELLHSVYWSVGEMKSKGEKKGPDLFALTDDISNIKTGMLDLVQLINYTANF